MGSRRTGINIEHQGRVYDVTVEDSGSFVATVDGATFRAETLKQLRVATLAHLKRQTKPLRLTAYVLPHNGWGRGDDGDPMVPVVITGVHGGNGNILYRKPGDKSSTQEGYSTRFYQFTTLELNHINALREQQKSINDRVEQFLLKHKVNAKLLVVEALKKNGDDAADIDTTED